MLIECGIRTASFKPINQKTGTQNTFMSIKINILTFFQHLPLSSKKSFKTTILLKKKQFGGQ